METNSAYRTATFGAGVIAVANGLVTSIATAASPSTISGAGLNGANATNLKAALGPARTVSVTTSANAGSYNIGAGNAIVVTGTRARKIVTENLLLTATGGGETIKGQQVFDSITSIAIPAQVNTGGAFTFGVDAVCAPMGKTFYGFRTPLGGTVNVQYQDGTTDAMVVGANIGEPSAAERVLSSTAIAVCVYFE